nr:hypothetical protein [Bryobacter sp.]
MKKQHRDVLRQLLIGAAIGGVPVGAIMIVVLRSRPQLPPAWIFFPGVVAAMFLAPLVHELGHLIFGLTQRFRFCFLIVGPLAVRQEGGRWKVEWNRSLAMAGGIVGMTPEGEENLRRRMLWMVLGGPLTSLLAAPLALLTVPAGPMVVVGWVFGLLSAAIGLATMIPSQVEGLSSDGARVLQLWRGGPSAERYCRTIMLYSSSRAGVTPGQWSEAALSELEADPGEGADAMMALSLVYTWRLDRGEFVEAGEVLRRMLDQMDDYPVAGQGGLRLEAAWYEATHHRDLAAARGHLEGSRKVKMLNEGQRLRAEAAVHCLEGEAALASQKAEAALREIAKTSDAGARPLMERMVRAAVA